MTTYRHLFTPLDLGSRRLKNRIVFGAHTANMSRDGLPGEQHRAYYLERAIGGAAMIVVEPVPVHRTAVLTRGNFRPDDDAVIPGFRAITGACHAYDVVMIQQLYHVGQHGDFDNSFRPGWSPSGQPSYHDSDVAHAMSEAEIEEVIAGFVDAAWRARECGFDGVEIFSAYHGLVDQFWTPWSNRRDDRWGGSFANRMRFSADILGRIRKRCGADYIVGVNVSVDEATEVALSLADLQEIVAWHDARGLMDYVSVGTGSYFDFYPLMPTVLYADKLGAGPAEALKAVVRHARVQAESHIRTPEAADALIGAGQADMVAIVRGQIADPHLARKAAEGRPKEIRPCLSCNQMCWGRRSRDYWISCLVNPSAGREHEWGGDRFERAGRPQEILVVGGGPAGLEVARVASARGHRVVLAEAGERLGGAFRLAGLQPRRGQIIELLEWYNDELERRQVDVRCNAPMHAEEVLEFGARTVVIATGASPDGAGFQRALPGRDRLPGIDHPNVWPVEDVLRRAARPGKRVVVVDDGAHWRGAGTAWHLAEAGHDVIIVTPAAAIARELERMATDVPLRRRLRRLGAEFRTESAVTAWEGDAAVVISLLDGSSERIPADALVLATPPVAEIGLYDELVGRGLDLHAVGDCVAPRSAVMAIYEGRALGQTL